MSSSTARRPNAQRLLDVLPNARLIEAVDGRGPAQIVGVQVLPGTRLTPSYPFPIDPGEVGCFLNHRKCWQTIADTILPNGVRELTVETGGSTIQKKTHTSGKLMQEIKRAWYHTQVRQKPQRVKSLGCGRCAQIWQHFREIAEFRFSIVVR